MGGTVGVGDGEGDGIGDGEGDGDGGVDGSTEGQGTTEALGSGGLGSTEGHGSPEAAGDPSARTPGARAGATPIASTMSRSSAASVRRGTVMAGTP